MILNWTPESVNGQCPPKTAPGITEKGGFPAHFALWKWRVVYRKSWLGCMLSQSQQMEPEYNLQTPVPSALIDDAVANAFMESTCGGVFDWRSRL
jgi:hypothetical protein